MVDQKKAFTLVEMLIVVLIIGILAVALIPRLIGIQTRARDVARMTDIQQISTALSTYQVDNGRYVTGASAGWTDISTILSTALVSSGKSLKSLPKDPNSMALPYQYITNTDATVLALGSYHEGGGQGANWSGNTINKLDPIPGFAAAISPTIFVPVSITTAQGAAGTARYVLVN